MISQKVLILYVPFGAGHRAAAEAIAEVFARKYPGIEVKNINILDFTFGLLRANLPKAYNILSSKIPFFYKLIYKYHQRQFSHKFLNQISDAILKGPKFIEFVKEFNPDFIICTNPLPAHLVSRSKEKNIIQIPSANVCTDYGFHSFWYNKDINYYFVATEDIKKKLIAKRVDRKSVIVTGIPVKDRFLKQQDKQKILDSIGLDFGKPTLLIVGGKVSYEDVFYVINGIRNKNKKVQIIIVAGRDEGLKKVLDNSEIAKYPAVKIFGFVDNIEELMSASDLILTKAGGITVAECLVKGLPMIINDFIPGQEEDNVKYVVASKSGVEVRNNGQCIDAVVDLLSDKSKIESIRGDCLKASRPKAAEEIVDLIASKI